MTEAISNSSFDVISDEEYERQLAAYEPFTDAVRRLIDAGIRTGVDATTLADAQAEIEAIVGKLLAVEKTMPSIVRLASTGRPLSYANPTVGLRNAIAPPMGITHEGGPDYRGWAEFDLGLPYEGPPGLVHGGICALVLDQLLGEIASAGLTKPHFTGTITVRYLRGTPLGRVRAEAWVDRTDGVKTFARGTLSDAEGITVEADGIFIRPQWARE
ncbi:PaaI family thioesterase [Mycolicibacterium sp. CBMA 234]|uniref:PaaI family thioesterase n=1 Tax=Mycolicibacterium sp. CBMA 234 TaxID=1918495 RepID=UPI0028163915|nr:PaaI family thioesterase [Mycolicibacterium sp. CBMA 234]